MTLRRRRGRCVERLQTQALFISQLEDNLVATVRYLVADVERSLAFYTKALGFKLDQSMDPAFARVAENDVTLWLAGPQSSAARPMPDARRPDRGGWNRFVVEVAGVGSREPRKLSAASSTIT